MYPSGKYYGKISVLDIGLPHSSKWRVWGREDVRRTLKRRDPFSHKGSFGTGLLVAGSDEMPGCAILAGSAAMRVGIGKLMIGTTKYAASIVSPRLPEATYWQINHQSGEALRLPEGVDAVAVGPGIADADFIERFLTEIWPKAIPLVLDAGALQPRNWTKRKAPTVITPHPGEMARLTGLKVEEIQRNRIKVASDFAVRNGMIVVLKGKDTVIALPDGTGFVNLTGNPGLAKGGSGDALTGMILGLVASEPDPVAAVANAVYLHGLCADELLKEESERAIMAGDISATIGRVLRSLAETEENGSY
ncbi:MAG: NAD(P)H-hydrate dehydratase [Caldibacillus debilis]|nr:MAG: NAD(P)H-hydrate dehydratase [Caldibacillus debilis]